MTWIDDLKEKATADVSHSFILHFNVGDYVQAEVLLPNYLDQLLKRRTVIAHYDRAEGITFPLPSMEKRAKEIIFSGQDTQALDPTVAALQALTGQQGGGGSQELPRSAGTALPCLEKLLRYVCPGDPDTEGSQPLYNQTAVIIDYAEMLVPGGELGSMAPDDRNSLITLHKWANTPAIMATGNLLILITRNLQDIHPMLRAASSGYEAIEIPLPTENERYLFLEQSAIASDVPSWDMDKSQLARKTAGLSKKNVEDILLRAYKTGTLTNTLVQERKASIIASEYGDVLEIIDPRFGFEAIGGLEQVKRYFLKNVIAPMRDGNTRRAPQGVLLVGPAGTGKSALSEAVAYEAGINFLKFNVGQIMGKYVGQSEANMKKALQAVASLAPCGCFIDEIDKGLGQSGNGDSGVSDRLYKELLEFMANSANRGKVLWLAATNRPDQMDARLRREGRFDEKVPILAPNADERRLILCVLAQRYGLGTIKPSEIAQEVIDKTEGWVGAALERMVIKANTILEDQELSPQISLLHASSKITASTTDIELMTQLALKEVTDTDLLPKEYQKQSQDKAALDKKIQELTPRRTRRGQGDDL